MSKLVLVKEEDYINLLREYIIHNDKVDYGKKYSNSTIECGDVDLAINGLKTIINADAKQKMAIIQAISILNKVKESCLNKGE